MRNTYKILIRKPEGNILLGTHSCIQEDGTGMNLKDRPIGCQDFNSIHVTEYWVK
jgi:hypothetical protein